MATCKHKRAIPKMVGRWCPDCGAFKDSGSFSDEDGAVHKTGAKWEQPTELAAAQDRITALEKAATPIIDAYREYCDGVREDLGMDKDTLVGIEWQTETSWFYALDAALKAAEKERDDIKEVLQDKRRLTRELDVAMHGDDAAEQASLVDLIGPAEDLRKSLAAAQRTIARQGAALSVAEEVADVVAEMLDRDPAAMLCRWKRVRAAALRDEETAGEPQRR